MLALLRFKYCLILFLFPALLLAKESGVFINKLKVYHYQQNYLLDADVHFELSPTVEQALRNSVSLVWVIHYKVWKKRKWLWPSEQVNVRQRYRIRYHALFDRFQIMDEQDHTLERFISLRAAFSHLGKIRALNIISQKALDTGASYEVGLQITLDKQQLPLALKAQAYINSDWSLTSQWQRLLLE